MVLVRPYSQSGSRTPAGQSGLGWLERVRAHTRLQCETGSLGQIQTDLEKFWNSQQLFTDCLKRKSIFTRPWHWLYCVRSRIKVRLHREDVRGARDLRILLTVYMCLHYIKRQNRRRMHLRTESSTQGHSLEVCVCHGLAIIVPVQIVSDPVPASDTAATLREP